MVLQQALLSEPQVQPALPSCSVSQPSLSLAPPVPGSLSSGCGGQDLLEKAEYVMHDSNQLPPNNSSGVPLACGSPPCGIAFSPFIIYMLPPDLRVRS